MSEPDASMRICVVCTGNICRSPLAAAILRTQAAARGLRWHVESAAVSAFHIGESADPRTRKVALAHGVRIDTLAQRFTPDMFARFDWILPVDQGHERELRRLARSDEEQAKVRLLRSFEPGAAAGAEVPDPYYGELDGFERVHAICEAACAGVLEQLAPSSPHG